MSPTRSSVSAVALVLTAIAACSSSHQSAPPVTATSDSLLASVPVPPGGTHDAGAERGGDIALNYATSVDELKAWYALNMPEGKTWNGLRWCDSRAGTAPGNLILAWHLASGPEDFLTVDIGTRAPARGAFVLISRDLHDDPTCASG